MTKQGSIRDVVSGGFCIGCGGCALQDRKIRMVDSTEGLPQASISDRLDETPDAVCPFAAPLSEDDIAERLLKEAPKFDSRIGRFIDSYVGHVSDERMRERSSSGGVVSWLLRRLLECGEIDGVIHVGRAPMGGYRYLVSESYADIAANAKSRYYPVHFEEALSSVLGNGKRYAFVGVPCFVKAVRLLSINDEDVRKSIRYCLAIFCGHMKTTAFSEMIAMQQRVPYSARKYVDFRVKSRNAPANRYSSRVYYVSSDGVERATPPVAASAMHGMDWGLGYFKAPACDWCDDIAGETADFSCGDAWLPEYTSDPLGTSVMISRNAVIDGLLRDGWERRELIIRPVDADAIYASQAGNYRHRHEGLSVRLVDAERQGRWVPRKRIRPGSFRVGWRRRAIYRHRQRLARRSRTAFAEVAGGKSYIFFMLKMLPLELLYVFLNGNIIRGLAKIFIQYGRYLIFGKRGGR